MVLPLCGRLLECDWVFRLGPESTFLQGWQWRGHSCNLGGPLLGLPGALGCLAALSVSLWNELVSSCSDAFTRDAAGRPAQE